MTRPEDSLIEELKAVFPAKRDRWMRDLVNSRLGDEPYRIAEAFADKDDWTTLDPEWLGGVPDGLGSAMSFLSDEAICFYLPAFIAAHLGGHLRAFTPDFPLTHGFDDASRNKEISPKRDETWGEYAVKRWQHLTPDQCFAVVHYLEWVIAQEGRDFAPGTFEALSSYWYPRIAETKLPRKG